jgi:hypothetical protein
VVGGLDHVQVVLDDDHRVPGLHQPVQAVQQLLDVGQVQARRRLVQDVNGMPPRLDPLRLAAGELGGRVTQLQTRWEPERIPLRL